jgi:hypothetical protein
MTKTTPTKRSKKVFFGTKEITYYKTMNYRDGTSELKRKK